jgi:ABC-type bacteriocin/lantibiotic exporter with double-glycine peptidase domain
MQLADAFSAFVAANGLELDRSRVAETLPDDRAFADMVTLLRELGISARMVAQATTDLDFLSLPALVELKDGTAEVLVERTRSHAWLVGTSELPQRIQRGELQELLSGNAIEIAPELPEAGSLSAAAAKFLLTHTWALSVLCAASLVMKVVEAGLPLLLRQSVDQVLVQGARHTLTAIVAALGLSAVLLAVVGWFRERALQYLSLRTIDTAVRAIVRDLVSQPLSMAQSVELGDSVQAVTAAEQIARLQSEVLLPHAADFLFGWIVVAALFHVVPFAGSVVGLSCVLLVAGAISAGHLGTAFQRRELEAQARQSGLLVEMITGASTLKESGAEEGAVRAWIRRLTVERQQNLKRQRVDAAFEVLSECLRHASMGGVLVWGGARALDGALSIGSIVAALALSQAALDTGDRFARAILRGFGIRNHALMAARVCNRNQTGRNPTRTPRWAPLSAPPNIGEMAIEMHDVWFRHGPELPWVVKSYQCEMRRGEETVLQGASGTGKTTLLRLMAGVFNPERGLVLVNGTEATRARGAVAYVPQDAYLFQGSLLDNLRILSGGAPRADLLRAARLTGLEEIIDAMGMGFETIVPPGAPTMSGGQRQLVVLTACVASKRQIILLDEAMSQIDRLTQAKLRKAALFAGKTVVSVMHDVA